MSQRILLVEDEAPTVRIMRMALEKQGYSVDVKHNGKDALASVLADAPDVLVTDIEMPVMSGQELCLAIVDQLPNRSFPIYVVTSVTDLIHRTWTQNIDDLYFIEKPVSIKKLSKAIGSRVGSAESGS